MRYREATPTVPHSSEVPSFRFFKSATSPVQNTKALIVGLNSNKNEIGIRSAYLLIELVRERTTLPAEQNRLLAGLYNYIFKRSATLGPELFERAANDIGPGLAASLFLRKFGKEETVKLSTSNGHSKEALRALLPYLGSELFEILERQFGPKKAFWMAASAFGMEEALFGFATAFGEKTNVRILDSLGNQIAAILTNSIHIEENIESRFRSLSLSSCFGTPPAARYPLVSTAHLIAAYGLKDTVKHSAEAIGNERTFEILASMNRSALLFSTLVAAFGDEDNAFRFVATFDQTRAFSVARDSIGEKKAFVLATRLLKPREKAIEA
ncbi:MAG: hypothetical protein V1909_00005, partial [Candidatus Micrarchaeota archaeon]